ncbi:Os07g0610950 [Oryza sativa Japonica Group]|uniref:Os07g0610950 protein n=1 Tax=Oryza sativa subsp. japonica TaxID=39947 RepID=A0A0P0X8R1_ORYSJ|nr:Os07g0610950 [Oryza sativa Japonica Group]
MVVESWRVLLPRKNYLRRDIFVLSPRIAHLEPTRREPRGSHHRLDDLACSTALDASYSLAPAALAASAALDEFASLSGIARAAPSPTAPPRRPTFRRVRLSDLRLRSQHRATGRRRDLVLLAIPPSSSSASSPMLGSSPVHLRPPLIPQPRGQAPNPYPPKRNPQPPEPMTTNLSTSESSSKTPLIGCSAALQRIS